MREKLVRRGKIRGEFQKFCLSNLVNVGRKRDKSFWLILKTSIRKKSCHALFYPSDRQKTFSVDQMKKFIRKNSRRNLFDKEKLLAKKKHLLDAGDP